MRPSAGPTAALRRLAETRARTTAASVPQRYRSLAAMRPSGAASSRRWRPAAVRPRREVQRSAQAALPRAAASACAPRRAAASSGCLTRAWAPRRAVRPRRRPAAPTSSGSSALGQAARTGLERLAAPTGTLHRRPARAPVGRSRWRREEAPDSPRRPAGAPGSQASAAPRRASVPGLHTGWPRAGAACTRSQRLAAPAPALGRPLNGRTSNTVDRCPSASTRTSGTASCGSEITPNRRSFEGPIPSPHVAPRERRGRHGAAHFLTPLLSAQVWLWQSSLTTQA